LLTGAADERTGEHPAGQPVRHAAAGNQAARTGEYGIA
jgi:hypothetical protein